jgi:low temperature requirement protein LtrA
VLENLTDPYRRARLGLNAWGYAHYVMLLGIVILAVGIKKTVGHTFEELHWDAALALSGGVALYLLGHAGFLALMRLRGVYHRLAATALVLALIPLGHLVALVQLAGIVIVMAATAIIEDVPEMRRTGNTAIGDFGRTG